MPRCTIALSANAGVSITLGGLRVLADALHTEKTGGFSAVSPERWEAMRTLPSFQNPDFIFFTHCHPDHYSKALTQEAKRLWPAAGLILPEQEFEEQHLLAGREAAFSHKGVSFRFLRLPHEGGVYAEVPHYGLLLSHEGFQVLLTGDCEVASPALKEALRGNPPDLALLDFPWITLSRGRAFLRDVLRLKHLLVCHLPFPQDDIYGYRGAAEKYLKRVECPDVRLLGEPFQVESYY